jgi:hypothetical protein
VDEITAIQLPDGTEIKTKKDSLRVDRIPYDEWVKKVTVVPTKAPDDDNTALIIGIVAAVIGGIGLIIIIIGYIAYKNKQGYKADSLPKDTYVDLKPRKNEYTTQPTPAAPPSIQQQQSQPEPQFQIPQPQTQTQHPPYNPHRPSSGSVQTTGIRESASYNNPAYTDIP